MQFQSGQIYHIFNQGNKRQKIFFKRENYLFFLKKLRQFVLPYCDILAWCLMPNHFHLMVLVNKVQLSLQDRSELPRQVVRSRSATPSRTPTANQPLAKENLNKSIGIMLSSYTRAIQKQENFTGSLFRQKTKAECVTCFNGLTPSFIVKDGITQNNRLTPEKQYPQVLFNYIHLNPLKAGLVKHVLDWEFSSAKDYFGLRDGTLINKDIAKQIVDIRLFE
jgi:putative transposase